MKNHNCKQLDDNNYCNLYKIYCENKVTCNLTIERISMSKRIEWEHKINELEKNKNEKE